MLTRRRVIMAAGTSLGLAGLAGCRAPWTAPPNPDAQRLEAAARTEHALLAHYADVVEAHPELTGALAPLRADHERHLSALGPHLTPEGRRRAARVRRPPATVGDLTAARDALRRAEHDASAAGAAAALPAHPHLAMLLASIAACEATHADRLAGA